MEVMRVPPYPLTTVWNLPIPSYEYILSIEDLVDHSIEETNVFSDANGKVEYTLPLAKVQYDRNFFIKFYDTEHEHTLYESNLDVIRPYVNPETLGTTASEIEEYKMYELIARSMIDTKVGNGFYNHKLVLQGVGQGTDYFPLWEDTSRVLKVYENDILVYDIDAEDPATNVYTYKVTLDNSAIYRIDPSDLAGDTINRIEYHPPVLPSASGDLGHVGYRTVAFPRGYDYIFILDSGYKAVPPDIEIATKMLIEDLKCGKLEYYKRYMSSYNTDQFRIQFDKSMLSGTGNFLVDKILEKYETTITKPGVL
jgi:hypothetical protein